MQNSFLLSTHKLAIPLGRMFFHVKCHFVNSRSLHWNTVLAERTEAIFWASKLLSSLQILRFILQVSWCFEPSITRVKMFEMMGSVTEMSGVLAPTSFSTLKKYGWHCHILSLAMEALPVMITHAFCTISCGDTNQTLGNCKQP